MSQNNLHRRQFIKGASAVLALSAFRANGMNFFSSAPPRRVALIGTGWYGKSDLFRLIQVAPVEVVALCDVDDRMSADSRKKHPNAIYYKDFRVMLDKQAKDIDAVIVSTPDHMHAVMAIPCMQLGKHVYVEKPLTHDIYEARILTEAEKKYKVVTQMGNQGSSGDDTRIIETWVQTGLIGDVHTVHVWTNRPVWPQGIPRPTGTFDIPQELDWNLWLGTAPPREYNPIYVPANWRGWVDFGTGSLGDMGCHFIDVPYRSLKLGYPVSVECSVTSVYTGFFQEAFYTDSYPPSSKTHIQFPQRGNMPALEMIWYDGGIKPKRPAELLPDEPLGEWDGGIIFEGTKGKIMAGLWGRNPTLLPTKKMKEVKLPDPKKAKVEGGVYGHQTQWVNACKKGYGGYTSSPFSESGPLTETVLMGNLAVLSYNYIEKDSKGNNQFPGRKKLLWDGANMKITNFDPANQFVKRKYAGDWKLEL